MSGEFRGLDLATLRTMRTTYTDAITALATAQSYSIAGRSVSRADLSSIVATLGKINAEIRRQEGTRVSMVYAGMNSRLTST
jgi:hypothetical protein